MTTYQDQPLSRRAIREREAEAARAAGAPESGAPEDGAPEANSSAAPAYGGTSEPIAPEPLTYVTQGRTPLPQYDAPVASAPSAPETPADAVEGDSGYRYRDFSPEGRRAARLGWPQTSSESSDLDYRTQGRADVPAPAPAPEQAAPEIDQATPAPVPAAEQQQAPESGLSRRELRALREAQDREAGIVPPSDEPAGFASAPPVASASPAYAPAASAPPASAPPVAESEQPSAPAATPEWLAAFAPPTAAVSAQPVEQQPQSQPAFDDILIGETVDDADDVSGPVVVAEQVREVPPPLIEPEAPPTDALASFEALFRSDTGVTPAQQTTPPMSAAQSASPVFPMPLVSTPPAAAYTAPPVAPPSAPPVETPVAEAPQYEAPQPEAPQYEAPQAEAPQPAASVPPAAAAALPTFAQYSDGLQPPSPFDQETVSAPGVVPAPVAPAAPPLNLTFLPTASVPIASEAIVEQPEAEAPAPSSQPPVAGERPRNHWSRQAELDDEAQPATGSLTRDVGVGSATANALVLSDIPSPDIMATPLTSTGDVLVTGSISLPASLSSTGALPTQLDESDLDHLLDPGDHQVASTDSQPVRAIRAVSTHTSSREIIGTIKPKRSNRALTALIISAAGMAVVVVTLLVVALVSGVLG